MKNILFIFVFALCLFSVSSKAKVYEDKQKGYKVEAEATCVGYYDKEHNEDFEKYREALFNSLCDNAKENVEVRYVLKLSKKHIWGIKQALLEFDTEINELYLVSTILEDEDSLFQTLLLIKDDKGNFDIIDKIEMYFVSDSSKKDDTVESPLANKEGYAYSSESLGYSGCCTVKYLENNGEYGADLAFSFFLEYMNNDDFFARELQNLTSEEKWLLNTALKKYDVKVNDNYSVAIQVYPKSYQTVFVVRTVMVFLAITDIDKNTGSYNYIYKSIEVYAKEKD